MTKLANHIINKTHRIVNEQEEALFNASQFNRLTKVRARKAIVNTMSSPEGIALTFFVGALSAKYGKYGKYGALRKVVLMRRVLQGLI